MENETVCLNHTYRLAALLNAVPVIQLDRSQVTEEQNVRSNIPDLKRPDRTRFLQRDPLRPQPHGQAQMLSCTRQVSIDLLCQIKSPRSLRKLTEVPSVPFRERWSRGRYPQCPIREGRYGQRCNCPSPYCEEMQRSRPLDRVRGAPSFFAAFSRGSFYPFWVPWYGGHELIGAASRLACAAYR